MSNSPNDILFITREEHAALYSGLARRIAVLEAALGQRSRPVEATKYDAVGIGHLGISVRTHNALVRNHITSIDQLTRATERDLLHMETLGRKGVDELIGALRLLGLSLLDGAQQSAAPCAPQTRPAGEEPAPDDLPQQTEPAALPARPALFCDGATKWIR